MSLDLSSSSLAESDGLDFKSPIEPKKTLKRKLSIPTSSSSLDRGDEMDLNDFVEEVSEVEERRARNRLIKRQSFGKSGADPRQESQLISNAQVAGYSAAQVVEHYMNCMKLSAENKINIKNAFDLNVIDCMAEMINKNQAQINNFQTASVGLDASTKIYACRVDSIHSETLKLASGVGSSKEKEQTGEGLEGDDEEAGIKARKVRRKKASTVEKNLKNINCNKIDLEYQEDPLFKKVSAQFDSGGGGGQFLASLRMRDDSCELLLDSNAYLEDGLEIEANFMGQLIPLEEDIFPPQILSENNVICPTFCNFKFRDWNIDLEDLNSSTNEENDTSGLIEKSQKFVQFDRNEHLFDPTDAAENDDYIGLGDDDMEMMIGEDNNIKLSSDATPLGLWNHLASIPSEYTYFDTGKLGGWAGPQHWKFKSGSKLSKDAKAPEKKRDDKKPLDLAHLHDEKNLSNDVIEKSMTISDKPTTLQSKTMKAWNSDKLLFPDDLQYSGKQFVHLEILPLAVVTQKSSTESQSVDESIADYNFDNENDSQNFCPDTNQVTTVNDTSMNFTNVFTQTMVDPGGEEFDMVEAPSKVRLDQIGYAKLAKKIDMKRLKKVTLSILQKTISCGKNKENICNQEKDIDYPSPNEATELQFSKMYKKLTGHQDIPSKQTDSLSIPLAFITLLHLCNENNLELHSRNDLADLTINKG